MLNSDWLLSFKLLWSCFMDAIWIDKIGQRKTWIVGAQSTIGISLFLLGYMFTSLIETKNVVAITACFFVIVFMVTCQVI